MTERRITYKDIFNNMTDKELEHFANKAGYSLNNHPTHLRNLLITNKRKGERRDKKDISINIFMKNYKPYLSDETVLKLYPEYAKIMDFDRKNTDKINASSFTDKINAIKATIEKQIRKMNELIEQEKEWNRNQEEERKQQEAYDKAYEMYAKEHITEDLLRDTQNKIYQEVFWNKKQEDEYEKQKAYEEAYNKYFSEAQNENEKSETHIINYMSEPEKRLFKAQFKPLDTVIRLEDLDDIERQEMGIRLKEFYEKNIKTQQLNNKILVGYFINGEWIFRPLDNQQVKESLENMLNGNYVFSCDNIPTIWSDAEANISLSFIDAIKFTLLTDKKQHNERNRVNAGGFFPYRLKKEYKEFEIFTNQLAIGCELYDFKKNCVKDWLKSCCLVYAIQQIYPNETVLLEELNRKLNGVKYVGNDQLTEIGNIFNIKFVLRSKDNQVKKTRKGNNENGGFYGPNDAKYIVEIARIENHIFIYKSVPVSRFFIKNYHDIRFYGNGHGWDFKKCCLTYERKQNGNYKK